MENELVLNNLNMRAKCILHQSFITVKLQNNFHYRTKKVLTKIQKTEEKQCCRFAPISFRLYYRVLNIKYNNTDIFKQESLPYSTQKFYD